MLEQVQAVLAIVLIDLALSGDNALVIGLAARGLPTAQRRKAILLGGLAAVALRVVAASAVTLLLAIPYLQLAGALALVVIAYRLVRPPEPGKGHRVRAAASLREAVVTILVADAVMSLENVLGVGAAAHGSIPLLAFGLALSIPIVLLGSDLVARLVTRFTRAIWLGAFALVWTAATMLTDEPALGLPSSSAYVDMGLALAMLGLVALARRLLQRKDAPREAHAG